jgi:single-stranded-DNA-specific exonuclease
VLEKQIELKPQKPQIARSIEDEYGLRSLSSRILAARGYEAGASLEKFLEPSLKTGLIKPDGLKGLAAACELVSQMVKDKKVISIACDFDVDGLSGGSQLVHFFRSIGVECHAFVPDRFEDGYGLNAKIIAAAAEVNTSLLIAVDFGTTAHKELALAKTAGMLTLVIDHHHVETGSEPKCDVFINPQQVGCGFADKTLCAAGLVWYFLLGLKESLKEILPVVGTVDVRSYLDLACLGTVCDMVPLVGVNRVIARRGLELLSLTKRPGLVALKNVAGIRDEVSCYDLSFALGPRINAAGRMVHGELVIELLTTSDSTKAASIAGRLNKLNSDRQETEKEAKRLCLKKVEKIYPEGSIPEAIVLWDEEFHTGVVGIVAQRLVEMFHKPAVVLGIDKDGLFKGSVRGIKGMSVVSALSANSDLLLKYGGHEAAGGLTLAADNLEKFCSGFINYCSSQISKEKFIPRILADTEVGLSEITKPSIDEFDRFAPFGMGNPSPAVLARGLTVQSVSEIKGTHTKASLTDGRSFIAGMLWRQVDHPLIRKGSKVDVVFKPDYSTFNGICEIQANIQAVQASSRS